MSDIFKPFYEKYWHDDGLLLPEGDPSTPERKSRLARSLKDYSNVLTVLDAGCGTGEFTEYLCELGFNAFGVDLSTSALSKARKRSLSDRYVEASLHNSLPFADNSFDAIWFSEVIEHILDVHSCVAELNRLLKTNGVLIITTPYHGLIKNLLITLFNFNNYFSPYTSHIRFFSKETIHMSLENAGFRIVRTEYLGRFYPVNRLFYLVAEKSHKPDMCPHICG